MKQLYAIYLIHLNIFNAFLHYIIFHFRIKPDGKIWLIHNRTDKDVAETLVERGVSKKNIVIGFYPQQYRAYTGYALA